MPERKTIKKAKADLRRGKRPTTAAREGIEHVGEGKHGARSTKQAIATGLSKARRAGVPLKAPEKGGTSERTRRAAERAHRESLSRQARRSHAQRKPPMAVLHNDEGW